MGAYEWVELVTGILGLGGLAIYLTRKPMKVEPQTYRDGTLRYTNEEGNQDIAEPGSYWYSTFIMIAQEAWSEKEQRFVPIHGDYDAEYE